MKIAAFIFARGGSKGLPGKNIKIFAGKPLIAWAIQHALGVKGVTQVYVSTDCQDIAEIAKQYGAQVPFMRPKELSTDHSPEWDSWRHALNYFIGMKGYAPDVFLSIPVTSPLRYISDIEKCLLTFVENNSDAVIAVTEPHRNPYFNMVKIEPKGTCVPVLDTKKNITRRQDADQVFDMTTVAYALKPSFILNSSHLFDGVVHCVEVPAERSIDIDTLLDFDIAEFIYIRRAYKLDNI